jgi:hypothetical protein
MSIESNILAMKEYLVRGISLFPILIATVSFVLFAGLGNTAFLFLFIGLGFLVPILVYILNLGASVALESFPNIWAVKGTDCMFRNGSDGVKSAFPSYWMSGTVFFIVYFLLNAYTLYTRPSAENAPEDKVRLRKTQASIAMFVVTIIGLALVGMRLFSSSCETPIGALVGIGVGFVGVWWFKVLQACSADRLTDLFGIVSKIVPDSSTNRMKKICYPVADE